MAKIKNYFVCQNCGYRVSKWLGRCPECQSWESFKEEKPLNTINNSNITISPLSAVSQTDTIRITTGINELDRVLGGGLAPGAVTLLAGEPGVGKSTLLLQAAAGAAQNGKRLLYIAGEESTSQIRMRAERLALDLSNLWAMAETDINSIISSLDSHPWDILAVDSIQTLTTSEQVSGGPAQIKEAASKLINLAKKYNKPVWIVGHITKEGSIAGPKLLEHLVDTVLYFEGEKERSLRLLRAFKNRFGPVNEIGVFEMTEKGLSEVLNPSALFLAERPIEASGSVVSPVMEGQRPLLMEIQSLVSASPLPMPRRQSLGVDAARVNLLAAVLEKKMKIKLFDRDIFVNVAGGAKIIEPAADLAIMASIASSWIDRPIPPKTVIMGEVGLAGEIRSVGHLEARLTEAHKMGFSIAVIPKGSKINKKFNGLELLPMSSTSQLLNALLGYNLK